MNQNRHNKPELKLIHGGLHCKMSYGGLKIVAGPEYSPPFKVGASAAEEDTFLIMSADTEVREPALHPILLMKKLKETEPETPGTVKVIGSNPFKFLAIVHDVNQEPTWKEAWIESALINVFQESEKRNLKALALPLIGTKYGSLKPERFAAILGNVITPLPVTSLKRLWIIAPTGTNRIVIKTLKAILTVHK